MKQFFEDYFTFNKKERNGILVLCSMIAFLILYLNLQQFFVRPPSIESEDMQSRIDGFLEQEKAKKQGKQERSYEAKPSYFSGKAPVTEVSTSSTEYFPFNPNTATESDWTKLGLKKWQIKAVAKYKEKAGDFKSVKDFKRLKAIRDDQFKSLEPYIQLPALNETTGSSEEEIESPKLPLFELNQSTVGDLRKIRGIGPVLSGRIVEYRKLLGGYIAVNQILEVYGIEDSLLNAIAEQLFVDKSIIFKININKAPASRFSKHPYISRNIANAIVNYRDQHGVYNEIKDIRNTDVVSDALYARILPYLSLY